MKLSIPAWDTCFWRQSPHIIWHWYSGNIRIAGNPPEFKIRHGWYAWKLYHVKHENGHRYDSRLAPSQWETALQSNAVSHWLGTNLESAVVSTRHELTETMLAPTSVYHASSFVRLATWNIHEQLHVHVVSCSESLGKWTSHRPCWLQLPGWNAWIMIRWVDQWNLKISWTHCMLSVHLVDDGIQRRDSIGQETVLFVHKQPQTWEASVCVLSSKISMPCTWRQTPFNTNQWGMIYTVLGWLESWKRCLGLFSLFI